MSETSQSGVSYQLKTPSPMLKIIGIIFTIVVSFILAFIIDNGGWDWQAKPPEDVLLPNPTIQDPSNSSCNSVSDEEITSCCAQWAVDNDLMLAQCVGSWQLIDGQCSWNCQTDAEGL